MQVFFATSTTGRCIAQRSSVTVAAPARYERGGQRGKTFVMGGIIISFYGFEMENNLSSKIKLTQVTQQTVVMLLQYK